MPSLKFWPNQWLFLLAFVVCLAILMTGSHIYLVNLICCGALSIIVADIFVKAYEVFIYRRRFLEGLNKKAVLVTGCDTGFGFLYAQKLADLGLVVYAGVLSSDGDGAQILKTRANIVVVVLDVTDQTNIENVVEFVTDDLKKRGRTFWSLVNNAGLILYSDVEFASLHHFQRVIEVNVFGSVRTCKAFLPLLRAARGGRIVNITSQASKVTMPCTTAYSMSKHALAAFSSGLNLELLPWNISVHTVAPFFYQTAISWEATVKVVFDNYMKMWHSAPAEAKHAYGETYREAMIKSYNDFMIKNLKPKELLYEVIDDLVHAVAGVDPKLQYTPGTIVKIQMKLLSLMPQEIVDFFLTPDMQELPAALKAESLATRKHS